MGKVAFPPPIHVHHRKASFNALPEGKAPTKPRESCSLPRLPRQGMSLQPGPVRRDSWSLGNCHHGPLTTRNLIAGTHLWKGRPSIVAVVTICIRKGFMWARVSYNILKLDMVSTSAPREALTVSTPARVQGKKPTPLHSAWLKKWEFSPKAGTK